MRSTTAALIIASGFVVSLAAGACTGKPSEEDCKKFADNFVQQMSAGQQGEAGDITRQVAEGMRPDLLEDCNKKGVKDEIDCAIQATTMEEIQKCSDPRNRGGNAQPASR